MIDRRYAVLSQVSTHMCIPERVVRDVISKSNVVFLEESKHKGEWRQMTYTKVCRGKFMRDRIARANWVSMGKPSEEKKDGMCICQMKFGHEMCVLQRIPLAEVEVDKESCHRHQKNWRELTPREKRKSMTRYYCNNYFSLGLDDYTVPACFLQGLEAYYPNPKKEFFAKHK